MRTSILYILALFGLQATEPPYSKMARVDEYLMERNAEIALARSAAPDSISRDAGVLMLGKHGYESVANAKNGFVCIVQRSWTADAEDPEFWNPKLRAPICYNPPAVRSYLPLILRKTDLVLGGNSKTQLIDSIKVAFEKRELPAIEPGAMCYMMSKQGHLSDRDGHWHPHLMFYTPLTAAITWGADLPGSPILAYPGALDRVTVFIVPVGKWSDGTVAPTM